MHPQDVGSTPGLSHSHRRVLTHLPAPGRGQPPAAHQFLGDLLRVVCDEGGRARSRATVPSTIVRAVPLGSVS